MEKNVGIRGASIIEVLITLVIVALLLMAMVTVFPRMTAHRKGIKEADNARILANTLLERVQTISRAEQVKGTPVACPVTNTDILNMVNQKNHGIDGVTYTVRYSAVCTGQYRTITLTVSWTKENKNRTISVTGVL